MQTKSESKTFNTEEFTRNVFKGAVIGAVSTTSTFGLIDKPLAYATKAVSEGGNPFRGFGFFAQQVKTGNFTGLLNNSLYAEAYRSTLQHPLKGYPIALLNSAIKNVVLLPMKYLAENVIGSLSSDGETGKSYAGFFAGLSTVYVTTPISVLKARMMTNVPLDTLSPKRLMSGVHAIALRDGVQFGIYFKTTDLLKAQFGDNAWAAGVAGIVGYIFSNPLSVIGLSQKTAPESVNLPNMARKIHQISGAKGFYPLVLLSAFGMFARGMAFDQGVKIYESLQNAPNDEPLEQITATPK